MVLIVGKSCCLYIYTHNKSAMCPLGNHIPTNSYISLFPPISDLLDTLPSPITVSGSIPPLPAYCLLYLHVSNTISIIPTRFQQTNSIKITFPTLPSSLSSLQQPKIQKTSKLNSFPTLSLTLSSLSNTVPILFPLFHPYFQPVSHSKPSSRPFSAQFHV